MNGSMEPMGTGIISHQYQQYGRNEKAHQKDLGAIVKTQKNMKLLQYKKAEDWEQNHTLYLPVDMQQPPDTAEQHFFHPHAPINFSQHLRNPVIHEELSPATLTITSNHARITEFCYNDNLSDPYYAKVYLPNATLIGFKNGQPKATPMPVFTSIPLTPAFST